MKTIDHIKCEACKSFGEKGYEATSMRDIAKQVGIKASSIYSHYESKEALFIEIFHCCIRDYNLDVFLASKFENKTAKEKLLTLLTNKIEFVNENPFILKFLLRNIFFPPEKLQEKLKVEYKEKTDRPYLNIYHEIYEELRESNLIKDDITEKGLIFSFERIFIGYVIQRSGLSFLNVEETVDDLFNLYWQGIEA